MLCAVSAWSDTSQTGATLLLMGTDDGLLAKRLDLPVLNRFCFEEEHKLVILSSQ